MSLVIGVGGRKTGKTHFARELFSRYPTIFKEGLVVCPNPVSEPKEWEWKSLPSHVCRSTIPDHVILEKLKTLNKQTPGHTIVSISKDGWLTKYNHDDPTQPFVSIWLPGYLGLADEFFRFEDGELQRLFPSMD